MEKIYRYRCIFDIRYSAIPHGDWEYIPYEKYCEIEEAIECGNKYELQVLLITHIKLPKENNNEH